MLITLCNFSRFITYWCFSGKIAPMTFKMYNYMSCGLVLCDNGFVPVLSSQGHQDVFFSSFFRPLGALIYFCPFIHILAFMSHISRFHFKSGLLKEAMDLDGSSPLLRVKDTHAHMVVMWNVRQRWSKIFVQGSSYILCRGKHAVSAVAQGILFMILTQEQQQKKGF